MSCKGRQPGPYLVIEAFEPILCSAAVQNVRDPVCEVVAMICVEPQRGLPVCYRHGLIKVHDSGRSADLKIQESQDLDLQRSDINSLHHPMGHGVEGSAFCQIVKDVCLGYCPHRHLGSLEEFEGGKHKHQRELLDCLVLGRDATRKEVHHARRRSRQGRLSKTMLTMRLFPGLHRIVHVLQLAPETDHQTARLSLHLSVESVVRKFFLCLAALECMQEKTFTFS